MQGDRPTRHIRLAFLDRLARTISLQSGLRFFVIFKTAKSHVASVADALGFEAVDGKAVPLRMDVVIGHFVNEEQVQAAKKERNKVHCGVMKFR
jgi:hypothetical protein